MAVALRAQAGSFLALVLLVGCTAGAETRPAQSSIPFEAVNPPPTCEAVGCAGATVDTLTGEYRVDEEDLIFPAGLFGVELNRSYRSGNDQIGWFGKGWSTVFETTITEAPQGGVTINAPAGLTPLWNPTDAPDGWRVAGSPIVDRDQSGAHALRWPTGELWTFGLTGNLERVDSPFEDTVTVTYSGNVPVRISSTQGVSIAFSANSTGLIERAESTDGRSTTYSYEGSDLTGVQRPIGDLTYRSVGGLLRERTGDGTTVEVTYDQNRVVEQKAPDQLLMKFEYNGNSTLVHSGTTTETFVHDDNRLVERQLNGMAVERRTFDPFGHLASATTLGADGTAASTTERKYDGDRLVVETVDGIATEFAYDDLGRVSGIATEGEDPVSLGYDEGLLPTTITSGDSVRSLEYSKGRLTKSIGQDRPVEFDHDDLGNTTGITTAGETLTFTFDPEGNVVTTTTPLGTTSRSEWEPGRREIRSIDGVGRQTKSEYDLAGREIRHVDGAGRLSTTSYDRAGRVLQHVSSAGFTTKYRYSADGDLVEYTTPSGRWAFDSGVDAGVRTETVTAPDGSRTITKYDLADRVLTTETLHADRSMAQTKQFQYDLSRVTLVTTDEVDSVEKTSLTYDDGGRVSTISKVLDGVAYSSQTFEYEHGRLTVVVDGDRRTEYTYDPSGQLIRLVDESGDRSAKYRDGLMVERTTKDGTDHFSYDPDEQLSTVTQADGTTVEWGYDRAGRPIERKVGNAVTTFGWSPLDQLTSYRDPAGNAWTYDYSPLGLLTEAVEPGGNVARYEYLNNLVSDIVFDRDGDDRHDEFEYGTDGVLIRAKVDGDTTEVERDPLGRVSSIKRGDDNEIWSYDAAGRVNRVRVSKDLTASISYDALDQITAIDSSDEKLLTATYDGTDLLSVQARDRDPIEIGRTGGRLTSVSWKDDRRVDLTWDATTLNISTNGEAPTQTYEFTGDQLNRFTSGDDSVEVTTRANGSIDELIYRTNDEQGSAKFDDLGRPYQLAQEDKRVELKYDAESRISQIDSTKDNSSETTTVSFEADGRKIEGPDWIAKNLYSETGFLRASLPSDLSPPAAATDPFVSLISTGALDQVGLESPEPNPVGGISDLLRATTPFLEAPLGLRDIKRFAERMAYRAIYEAAPTFQIFDDQFVRLPILNPENGELAEYNPFIEGAVTGLVLGALDHVRDGDSGLMSRAVNALGNAVGGAVNVIGGSVVWLLDHSEIPIVLALAACSFQPELCAAVAFVRTAIAAVNLVRAVIPAVDSGAASCWDRELGSCISSVWTVGTAVYTFGQEATTGTSARRSAALAQRLVRGPRSRSEPALSL
jgi:YD repeat-containing protein